MLIALFVAVLLCRGAAADGPVGLERPQLAGKLVCVGASITAGEGVTPDESYVGLLQAKVAAERLSLDVVRQGRSGWSTGAYVANARKIAAAMPGDATVVTILLGTNDSRDPALAAEVGVNARKNLGQLLDIYQAKLPHARFIILGPTKQYLQRFTPRLIKAAYGSHSIENLESVRQAFRDVAAKRKLMFIDLGHVPASADDSIDGVHLSAAGHQELYEALWAGLTQPVATTRP